MTYTLSANLIDREQAKFNNDIIGSAVLSNVALYGLSGTNWLPIKVLSDGTLMTSGAA